MGQQRRKSLRQMQGGVLKEIQTIILIVGFTRGGESSLARAHARKLHSREVHAVERPSKSTGKEPLTISIFYHCGRSIRVVHPHDDALVVTMVVSNFNLNRILIDNRSSNGILYWSAFEKMKINKKRITLVSLPLIGFTGNP